MKNEDQQFKLSKVEKTDEIDEKIIKLLSKNGRLLNVEIATALHISESTARRRINRLINEKTIKIVAVRNPAHFNKFSSSIINISCNRDLINQTEHFLTNCSETRYVGYSTGKWDLITEAFFLDNEHLLDFLLKLGNLEGVNDIETSVILRVSKFTYEWEHNIT